MAKRNTIFVNTSPIVEKINILNGFREKNWHNFDGNVSTFADIDAALKSEYDYLRNMWDTTTVNEKCFSLWDAMPAYYDIPDHIRNYTQASYRDGYGKKTTQTITKYDILHDRESYLLDLRFSISSLFHDWQFITQGWTAY